VEAHRVVRRRGSHFSRQSTQEMAARLSDLSAGRPSTPGGFLVLISVKGQVDPRAIVRLEISGIMTSSEIEPAAFRLVPTNYATAYHLK
jgi:hypothetical protein